MTLRSGFFFTVLSALLWGFTGTVTKLIFQGETSPIALVEIRLTLSAALLGLYLVVFARGLLRIERRDLPYFVLLGVGGMSMVQFTYLFTMSYTTVATAVFLQSLAPALMFLYAALSGGERLAPVKLVALGLAMTGSVFMIQGQGGLGGIHPLGLASGLASAFFSAFYTIVSKRGLAKYHPLTVLFWALALGAVPWWFVLAPNKVLAMAFSTRELLFFLYIAVFSTVVPFGLYFRGLRDLTPGQAGIIGTLEPVIATIAAYLILGESVGWWRLAGGLSVLTGVLILRLVPTAAETGDAADTSGVNTANPSGTKRVGQETLIG